MVSLSVYSTDSSGQGYFNSRHFFGVYAAGIIGYTKYAINAKGRQTENKNRFSAPVSVTHIFDLPWLVLTLLKIIVYYVKNSGFIGGHYKINIQSLGFATAFGDFVVVGVILFLISLFVLYIGAEGIKQLWRFPCLWP